jgi:alpha-glucosidase
MDANPHRPAALSAGTEAGHDDHAGSGMSISWWQRAVIYQVYPRSFQDSNGDGIGDLEGLRGRLDHISGLGADAIWLSPIYPSPMADFGYDVADYTGIDPLFGTLADFDALVADLHARGLKIILDFVPNHSSCAHPWFTESRSSRVNAKRDWYIWRDPAPDGGPPNNWRSNFGGSAWTLDNATGQYYHHAFLPEQPDLNWRNPDLVAAMHEVLRFWMRRGVDGFRVDVIWHLMKDPDFRDNPPNPFYVEGRPEIERLLQIRSSDHPDVHGVVAGLRRVLDEFDERVLIGEIYLPVERLVAYYGRDLEGAHLPFNFLLLQSAWNAASIASLVQEYESHLPEGGWPNWVLGNHDQKRLASRIGAAQARLAAMLLLTLRGTPTLYYGDEIGMEDVPVPHEYVQDPWERNEPGLGFGRDPQRTPMQWDATPHAGFTSGPPWLPLETNFRRRNVAVESGDPTSILSLYRRLIALRRAEPCLSIGSWHGVSADADVLVFQRSHGEQRLWIVLNFATEPRTFTLPVGSPATILLGTHLDREGPIEGDLQLAGAEGIILRMR